MKINAYKIRLAQLFLNRLKKELQKIQTKEDLVLEMYSNGREQGYHLTCHLEDGRTWGCSFSEARGSDGLIIYMDENPVRFGSSFSMQGNVPSEETYRKANYCSNNDAALATGASLIVVRLRQFLANVLVEERA